MKTQKIEKLMSKHGRMLLEHDGTEKSQKTLQRMNDLVVKNVDSYVGLSFIVTAAGWNATGSFVFVLSAKADTLKGAKFLLVSVV